MIGTRDAQPDLLRIDDARLVRRLFEQGVLFAAGAFLAAFAPWVALRVLGIAIVGLVYARNLEFVHECLHATALCSRRANRVVGRLLSLPMLVSFDRWGYEHARHHRDVQTEGFRYEYDRLTTLPELGLHLLMVRHFADAIVRLVVPRSRDYSLMLAAAIGWLAIALGFRQWWMLLLWPAPLPFAAIAHTLIELPEHLDRESASSDAFANSRIVRAGRFVTWLVNANNYHAIHHWQPRIPIGRLAAAAAQRGVVPEESYGTFYRAFFQRFRRTRC